MSSLWDRTQKLPKELLRQVEQVYGDHFPLDVRFQLALWIEESFFAHNVEIKQEDPNSQSMAAQLAQQLLLQLDAAAESIPNDPDKFLMRSGPAFLSTTFSIH